MIEEAVLAGILVAVGVFQLLQRTLTRIVIGVALISQGANLVLLVSGGPPGAPPLVGLDGPLSDPLPQALALTAIVITFAMLGFLLALAWRAAKLTGEDRVEDDIEDARVAASREADERLAAADLAAADRAATGGGADGRTGATGPTDGRTGGPELSRVGETP